MLLDGHRRNRQLYGYGLPFVGGAALPAEGKAMSAGGSQLDAICRRQTARLLDHLKDSGQLTARLERDVKRSLRFVFEDVRALQGPDTEQNHETTTE